MVVRVPNLRGMVIGKRKVSVMISEHIEFWEHYCPVEKDIIGTEKGCPCNWCDATEENTE